jgi:hypothetical protein
MPPFDANLSIAVMNGLASRPAANEADECCAISSAEASEDFSAN